MQVVQVSCWCVSDNGGLSGPCCARCFNYMRTVDTVAEKTFSLDRWAYHATQPQTQSLYLLWHGLKRLSGVVHVCNHLWRCGCVWGEILQAMWMHQCGLLVFTLCIPDFDVSRSPAYAKISGLKGKGCNKCHTHLYSQLIINADIRKSAPCVCVWPCDQGFAWRVFVHVPPLHCVYVCVHPKRIMRVFRGQQVGRFLPSSVLPSLPLPLSHSPNYISPRTLRPSTTYGKQLRWVMTTL